MTRYVALLRGINVGGHNRLPMATLLGAVESVGGTDVATYVQSGNVVFTAPRGAPTATPAMAEALRAALAAETGLDIAFVVRTADEWRAMIAANPYPAAANGAKALHVMSFAAPPGAALDAVDAARFAPEEFTVIGSDLYLHLPSGMGNSKLAGALEHASRAQPGTTRNWNTVSAIERLLDR